MLQVIDLALAPYAQALAFQRAHRERRLAGAAPDTLLLLEHSPVFTRGRGSSPSEFLTPPEMLEGLGFQVYDVERGGKTTYHGPGQLVGYPIISLRELRLGAVEYVGKLQDCIIGYLAGLGLAPSVREGFPGVWIEDRKIASIGVHLRQGVSIHGFALNIAPDLSHFGVIVPCGLPDVRVTSVLAESGRSPSMGEAKRDVAEHFRATFGYPSLEWVETTLAR